jgi:hypothetical protein
MFIENYTLLFHESDSALSYYIAPRLFRSFAFSCTFYRRHVYGYIYTYILTKFSFFSFLFAHTVVINQSPTTSWGGSIMRIYQDNWCILEIFSHIIRFSGILFCVSSVFHTRIPSGRYPNSIHTTYISINFVIFVYNKRRVTFHIYTHGMYGQQAPIRFQYMVLIV